MPMPYRLNPMGKNEKKYFELVIKPGILATGMSYGFTPYWNSGGYCKVDWGDGQKEDATKSGTKLNHTYAEAGTYTVKIKAECYYIIFGGSSILYDCSENWDFLGSLIGNSNASQIFDTCRNLVHTFKSLPSTLRYGYCMFRFCSKADFIFETLPDGLVDGGHMFNGCTNATLPLTKLPEGLTYGASMFYGCSNAQLPLTSLPDGLTNGNSMFYSCSKAELPLTSLPNALTNGLSMFYGCTNAELHLTSLPEGLTSGQNMFYKCSNAKLEIRKLPDGLTNASSMFEQCKNAEINLDTLVANAPAEGWTQLTTIAYMFNGSTKVTGSRSAFLAKCPNVTSTTGAFNGTNTTE